MTFMLSIFLTLSTSHPVMIYGCCPVTNFVIATAIPVLVIDRPVPVVPDLIAAKPHEAAI